MSANLASLKEIEALLRNVAAALETPQDISETEYYELAELCDRTADAIAEQRGTKHA